MSKRKQPEQPASEQPESKAGPLIPAGCCYHDVTTPDDEDARWEQLEADSLKRRREDRI